ncbi:dynein light chain binding protein [Aureococcus anophagefferens]|nr:dynein light chain binding protein [Aureococcus anophagefferens]
MQGDLKAQNEQLETQEAIGREQLEKMVVDQQQAEQKQAQGAVLQKELQARTGDIEERKKTAEAELAEAEPALIRAREAVSGIKKSQLDELRSLRNPPPNVKRTLEAVQILLGLLPLQASYSWDDVRKAMRKSDFIATVVGFSPSDIEDSNAKMVNDRYLKPSDAYLEKVNAKERDEKGDDAKEIVALDYDIVQRSSQAAGPLVLWASSQLSYCEIERKVEPLKQEVEKLESETKETRELVDALQKELEALAKSVAGYKDAYAAAVREGERIKADIDAGKTKAERAVRLLASLADEQDRWQEEAATFPETMQLVPYRALIAAANVAYCGPLSEGDRVAFQAAVRDAARGLHLVVDDEAGAYSLGGAVSRATARDWHETHGLPSDARFVANAAMLLGSKRCALLVDPSGGALRFVESLHAAARVAVVSAADASFEKTPRRRFGTARVVRDVDEAWDSAAHPLLNREFAKRGGGKAGVKLGGDFVEVSPDFTLVLHARSRAAADELPLGLLGRVALLDFSATAESLQATALSRFLRAERPALERDRVDAAKDLDAQRARLLALETDVLERITSSSEGEASLLDDDVALRALEAAKAEALEARARRDIGVDREAEGASDDFEAAAAFAADVYGVLARLVELHDAYAVSLDEFLDGALHAAPAATAPPPPGAEAPGARFARLAAPLVAQVSRRVGRALLSREHKVAASLALAALYADRAGDPALSSGPSPPRRAALGAGGGRGGDAAVRGRAPALALLACKAFRPDRVLDAADALVENVLGSDAADAWRGGAGAAASSRSRAPADGAARLGAFGDAKERRKQERKRRRSAGSLGKEDDLEVADGDRQQAPTLAVEADGDALAAPVALVVAERNGGRDAAEEVEAAARSLGVVVEAVAMGAAASKRRSRDLLRRGADAGCWVVFRNAHLASEAWLLGLEKALRGLRPAPGFRVVLTAEVAVGEPSRLPGRLVARAAVVALGADVGLRAALLRHEALLTQRDAEKGGAAWDRGPVERRRVHALLAVAHAVVTERARYSDAFTKPYEWGDVDAKCALEAADAAVDGLNAGDHAAPRTCPGPTPGGAPAAARRRADRDSWRAWIAALPRATPCDWLGLAPAADVRRAHDALQRFLGGLALRASAAPAPRSRSRDAGAARRLRDALQTAKLAAAAELGAPVDDLELAAAAGGFELGRRQRAALVGGSLDATAASGAPAALAVAWRPKQAPGPASALAPLRAGGDHVADVRLDAAPSAADAYLRNATLHFVGGV